MSVTHVHVLEPNDQMIRDWMAKRKQISQFQTTVPTSGGAVTADTNKPFTVFCASLSCGPAGWLALLLLKTDDVETNPGPTTSHKQVWIWEICYKQIHARI